MQSHPHTAGLFGRQGFLGFGGKENPYLRVTNHASPRQGTATIHFGQLMQYGNATAFFLLGNPMTIGNAQSSVLTKPIYNGLSHPTRFIIVQFSDRLFYKSIESSDDEFVLYEHGMTSSKSKTPISNGIPAHQGGFWGSSQPSSLHIENHFGSNIHFWFGLEKPSGIIEATGPQGNINNGNAVDVVKPPSKGFFGATRKMVCYVEQRHIIVLVNVDSDSYNVVSFMPNSVVFSNRAIQQQQQQPQQLQYHPFTPQALDVKHSGGHGNEAIVTTTKTAGTKQYRPSIPLQVSSTKPSPSIQKPPALFKGKF
jgi:hypothetical protein